MAAPVEQKRLLYTYDNECYHQEEEEERDGFKSSRCTFDIEILEFVIEAFICLFPTRDCCHEVNDFKNLECICVPCGDDSHCMSCRYGQSCGGWETAASGHASVDETKGEEDSSIRDYKPKKQPKA